MNFLRLRNLRRPRRFPNPEASIGEKVNINHERLRWWNEKDLCWRAAGPARETYEKLKSNIQKELNQNCTDSPSKTNLAVSIYMIGASETTAAPVVVFVCSHRKPAEEAKEIIKKSGILKDCPGFKTAIMPVLPTGKIVEKATGSGSGHASSLDQPLEVYFDPADLIRSIAMPVYVKLGDKTLRKSTANAMYNGKEYIYMTAAHAFRSTEVSEDPANDWGDDFLMSIDGEVGYGEEEMAELSRHSVSSVEEVTSNHSPAASSSSSEHLALSSGVVTTDSTSAQFPEIHFKHEEPLYELNSFQSSFHTALSSLERLGYLSTSSVEKDWALIRITSVRVIDELTSAGNDHNSFRVSRVSRARKANVVAYTSHGSILGQLAEATLLVRIPESNCFEDVFEFTYSGRLEIGDCGSLVVDQETRELYGHVIAGSQDSSIGYMMSGLQVATEIRLRTHFHWQEANAQVQPVPATPLTVRQTTTDTQVTAPIELTMNSVPLETETLDPVDSIRLSPWSSNNDGSSLEISDLSPAPRLIRRVPTLFERTTRFIRTGITRITGSADKPAHRPVDPFTRKIYLQITVDDEEIIQLVNAKLDSALPYNIMSESLYKRFRQPSLKDTREFFLNVHGKQLKSMGKIKGRFSLSEVRPYHDRLFSGNVVCTLPIKFKVAGHVAESVEEWDGIVTSLDDASDRSIQLDMDPDLSRMDDDDDDDVGEHNWPLRGVDVIIGKKTIRKHSLLGGEKPKKLRKKGRGGESGPSFRAWRSMPREPRELAESEAMTMELTPRELGMRELMTMSD